MQWFAVFVRAGREESKNLNWFPVPRTPPHPVHIPVEESLPIDGTVAVAQIVRQLQPYEGSVLGSFRAGHRPNVPHPANDDAPVRRDDLCQVARLKTFGGFWQKWQRLLGGNVV